MKVWQAALLIATAALGHAACSPRAPAGMPQPELSGVEAEVAEAVRQAQAAVGRDPESAEAWGVLGERYFDLEWAADAAACFAEAGRLDPAEFRWPYLQGMCLRYDDPQAAVRAYTAALALDERYGPVHLFLARALQRLGRFDEARDHFLEAERLDPEASHAAVGLAQLAFDEGDHEQARHWIEQALQRNPRDGEAHQLSSRVWFALGDPERAQLHARRARGLPKQTMVHDPRMISTLEPVGSRARLTRGIFEMQQGRLDRAETYLSQAIAINPRLQEAHYQLGRLALRRGELATAVGHLDRALALNPSHVDTLATLGEVLSRQGKLEQAITRLEQAVEIDPDRAQLRYLLGRGLARLLRMEQAEPHLRAALRIRPDHARARDVLGSALLAQRRWEEAADELFRALEGYARESMRELERAVALEQSGRAAEASRRREASRRADAAVLSARVRLGTALAESGRLDEARLQLERAQREGPSGELAAQLARALDQLALRAQQRPR